MERVIRTIPASVDRFQPANTKAFAKRRVAGYARVSTDKDDQFSSYEAQVDYYTKYIKSRSDWEFIEVYTDEGITGTSTKFREGFKRMIEDAISGKIDLIVTKSVSRFARNTVDSLTTIRKLKEKNIECYFEKENIWTFDSKGELLITIMSSLAQEESRSISENVTWGHRKRFADGKASIAFSTFLGYDKGPNGEFVVNEEQAEIVREIYSMFLKGMTNSRIASTLTKRGIPTPGGEKNWAGSTVASILQNEKYIGDALLQKFFTVDYLTRKVKRNEGEIPQYYVKNNHEAIISRDVFDLVQAEMARRKGKSGRYSNLKTFSSKIVCSQCGEYFTRKVWHSTSKYRSYVWQCGGKYKKGKPRCSTGHFKDDLIKDMFIIAINRLIASEPADVNEVLQSSIFNVSNLEKQCVQKRNKIEKLSDSLNNLIQKNALFVQNQSEYDEHYTALVSEFEKTKKELSSLEERIKDKKLRKVIVKEFLKNLNRISEPIEKFDETLLVTLVDHIVVNEKKEFKFVFKDNSTITV